jgi:hypothetical protein
MVCSGGAQEKGKTGWNSVYHQNWWFFSEFHLLLNANVLFWMSFFLNVTLCMTKLRVLVLCFSHFTDNSNITGYLNVFLITVVNIPEPGIWIFDNCSWIPSLIPGGGLLQFLIRVPHPGVHTIVCVSYILIIPYFLYIQTRG